MNERRLHPFTVLRFLRKTLVVYLLPLVQVLFERNWTALHTALRQDALLFLLLCAVSWGILRVSSWSMDDTGVFHLHWRLGIRLDRALRGEMLAALTIDRPLLYRMAGASRLTLYPVGAAQKHTLSVCLPKADAEAVADQLMPLVKPLPHGRPRASACLSGSRYGGGNRRGDPHQGSAALCRQQTLPGAPCGFGSFDARNRCACRDVGSSSS